MVLIVETRADWSITAEKKKVGNM